MKRKFNVVKALIAEMFRVILSSNRPKRFIARQVGTHLYEVYDVYQNSVIQSDRYMFRQYEAEAIADTLNEVVPNPN